MLKHIVMWKVKEGVEGRSKEESAKLIKDNMEGLINLIPELEAIQLGINALEDKDSYDLVLNADFADEKALEIYKYHEDHQVSVKFASTMLYDRVVIDYFY